MKALRNLALTLIVPVLVSSLSAAEKPEIVDEYLPVGKMAEAAAVSVVLDESLQPFMEKIDGVFASLPDKDKVLEAEAGAGSGPCGPGYFRLGGTEYLGFGCCGAAGAVADEHAEV